MNWNVGDGYAYGYKKNDPRQKGKFPSLLVHKISENNGMFFFNYIKFVYVLIKYIYI